MSTINQTQTNSNISWIPLVKNYTGTANQPDVVSFYLKSRHDSDQVKIDDEQIANSLGYSPKNWVTALPRIQKAVKVMFQEIKNRTCFEENSEFWNACKNGIRGIIQLVPLLGNAALYVYDQLRTTLYIHPKIKKELADQQEVVGVAFDGKPIFTIPISALEPSLRNANDLLKVLHYLWLSLKSDRIKANSTITARELAQTLCQAISNPSGLSFNTNPI